MPGDRIFKFSSEDSFHPYLFSWGHPGVEREEGPESPITTDFGDTTDEDNEDFWETQHHLLDVILSGTSSTESTILKATEEAVRDSQMEGNVSVCSWRYVPHGCQSCFLRDISERLRIAGFDCATCLSKWGSSSEIPPGMHRYLDVVEKSEKEEEVRVVIELNFRAEFEMARGSNEYKRVMNGFLRFLLGRRRGHVVWWRYFVWQLRKVWRKIGCIWVLGENTSTWKPSGLALVSWRQSMAIDLVPLKGPESKFS